MAYFNPKDFPNIAPLANDEKLLGEIIATEQNEGAAAAAKKLADHRTEHALAQLEEDMASLVAGYFGPK